MKAPAAVGVTVLACLTVAGLVRAAAPPAPATPSRQASFTTYPQWEGTNNRKGTLCLRKEFEFGWVAPAKLWPTGAIGGRIARSSDYRAYYAQVLPAPKTLDDPLSASGTIAAGGTRGDYMVGWFNSAASFDWRTPDFLGLRMDGIRRVSNAYGEFGTANVFSETTTPTRVPDHTRVPWSLTYLPDGGASGTGLLSLTIAGVTTEVSIAALQRADGATFDRFGLMNFQLDGAATTTYLDQLTIDGVSVDLTQDPQWDSANNAVSVHDCVVDNRDDFGYSPTTSFAGGSPGEIGGLVWRGVRASYADRIANVSLDDTLYAEGKLDVESATVDSDVFIGWFNSKSKLAGDFPANLVAADLGGPSDWGLRLYPVYEAGGLVSGTFMPIEKFERFVDAPLIAPRHHAWEWWLCYRPIEDGGRLTVGIADPSGVLPGTQVSTKVKSTARATHPVFDRFGIRSLEKGGHSITVYLDDLRYTSGPGDAGPDERCPLTNGS